MTLDTGKRSSINKSLLQPTLSSSRINDSKVSQNASMDKSETIDSCKIDNNSSKVLQAQMSKIGVCQKPLQDHSPPANMFSSIPNNSHLR